MNHSSRYRSSSPGSRRIVDPMRASTGTVSTIGSPTSRYGYDGYLSPVSAAERVSDAPYRSGQLEAQRISSTTYRDPGQSAKLRTEYAIRQRPRSSTSSIADPNRRPLSVIIPPANTQAPVITSAYDGSASPLPPRSSYEAERYLMPASSGYGRNRRYRSGYGSDTGRLDAGERAARRDSGVYRVYKQPSGWSTYGDPTKAEDPDYYDAYSYTNAREQFENESQRAPYRTGRPLSMTGLEDYLPPLPARKESRAQGPPPSQRGFDKLAEDDRVRRTARTNADSDATRDSVPARRRSSQRTPVDVHQDRDFRKDDHDDHRESRRHRRRHEGEGSGRQRRDDRDPRKHSAGEVANSFLGGLATLGLASGYAEDTLDYDHSSRREGHRSSRGADRGLEREGAIESAHGRPDGSIKAKSKGTEGVGSEAHGKSRRRSRTERHSRSDSEDTSSDDGLPKPKSEAARRRRDSGSSDGSRSPFEEGHKSRRRLKDSTAISPSSPENAETRQRQLIAVSPTQAKESETTPKSILKPPREKFPEEPNPIREGVAPLKDAHKRGIPPGARWTKIDRRLVNPAALEAGRERFEERSEYVVVLRVLTKEEIQNYAVKTQEVRDARNQAARRERRTLKEVDTSSDDEEKPRLAIEAPPPPAPPAPQEKKQPRTKPRIDGEAISEPMRSK
ncbi:hypothetical protein Egran_02493 [Elaphomyces granulatus]|uniref:DUF8035 domain-containing protein n=1 Tax=Elaphomyces granulatus TaxID=519963 RepID=A0A232M054_9EURO|nr:hypothetical protein Egran_02493 [Elaphomyces granulatus]